MSNKEVPIKYNTLYNLNKTIYLMGFKPIQFVVIMGGFLGGSLLSFYFGNVIFFILYVLFVGLPIYFLGIKINKENKKGNPDFVGESLKYLMQGKVYTDNTKIFKYLKK